MLIFVINIAVFIGYFKMSKRITSIVILTLCLLIVAMILVAVLYSKIKGNVKGDEGSQMFILTSLILFLYNLSVPFE